MIGIGSFDSRVYFSDQRNFKRVMNSIKMPTARGVSQIKFTEDGKGLIVGMRRDD
jgi:hypothetical protein